MDVSIKVSYFDALEIKTCLSSRRRGVAEQITWCEVRGDAVPQYLREDLQKLDDLLDIVTRSIETADKKERARFEKYARYYRE
ncbi:MAG: hypothetical protein MSS60_00235 [Clostridiales bacterium]|nr:hypothetical protein [Clostridiales bacterium]